MVDLPVPRSPSRLSNSGWSDTSVHHVRYREGEFVGGGWPVVDVVSELARWRVLRSLGIQPAVALPAQEDPCQQIFAVRVVPPERPPAEDCLLQGLTGRPVPQPLTEAYGCSLLVEHRLVSGIR